MTFPFCLADVTGSLRIPPMPVLSSLTLQVDVLRPSSVFYTLLFLRHLTAPSLSSLSFEVRCADGAAFLVFPWRPFVELLESSRFSVALKQLGFVFKLRDCTGASDGELSFMQGYIENLFAQWKDKGALRFTYAQQTLICKLVVALQY